MYNIRQVEAVRQVEASKGEPIDDLEAPTIQHHGWCKDMDDTTRLAQWCNTYEQLRWVVPKRIDKRIVHWPLPGE